jgi:diguanylate cyclase
MNVLGTVQELIANFAIVTAYLFLANQVIFKHWQLGNAVTPLMKVKLGVVAGIFGIILMIFTVHLNGAILDFRQLAIILSAFFGGLIPSLITGTIIFLMRIFAFGAISAPSIIAATNTLVVAFVVGLICTSQLTYWRKWLYCLLTSNLLTGAVFLVNLGSKGVVPAMIYISMMSVGGVLTAGLTNFLIRAKKQLQRYEKEATLDFLTGLYNHRIFDEKFNSCLQSAIDKKEGLSVVLVDIDYFKKVNDTYGHFNGDAVLKQLGSVLLASSRSFDTSFRNGGEEFSLLLYDTPHKHALVIAERIRTAVKQHAFLLTDGQEIHVTVSVGVATYPDTNPDELLSEADRALYKAKASGRDLVCSNQAEPRKRYGYNE